MFRSASNFGGCKPNDAYSSSSRIKCDKSTSPLDTASLGKKKDKEGTTATSFLAANGALPTSVSEFETMKCVVLTKDDEDEKEEDGVEDSMDDDDDDNDDDDDDA